MKPIHSSISSFMLCFITNDLARTLVENVYQDSDSNYTAFESSRWTTRVLSTIANPIPIPDLFYNTGYDVTLESLFHRDAFIAATATHQERMS